MQLVWRSTRRVEATEIGLKLYQHGRSIQDELVAARESVQSLGKTPQGKVRLSVPSGYGQFVMTPWLLEFKRDYPDIVLDVVREQRGRSAARRGRHRGAHHVGTAAEPGGA